MDIWQWEERLGGGWHLLISYIITHMFSAFGNLLVTQQNNHNTQHEPLELFGNGWIQECSEFQFYSIPNLESSYHYSLFLQLPYMNFHWQVLCVFFLLDLMPAALLFIDFVVLYIPYHVFSHKNKSYPSLKSKFSCQYFYQPQM